MRHIAKVKLMRHQPVIASLFAAEGMNRFSNLENKAGPIFLTFIRQHNFTMLTGGIGTIVPSYKLHENSIGILSV